MRAACSIAVSVFGEPLTAEQVVARICDDIRSHGLAALLDYTGKLDNVTLTVDVSQRFLDVLTGAQRSVTELRSDGRENLVTSLAIAAGHLRGDPLVPEVTIFEPDPVQ